MEVRKESREMSVVKGGGEKKRRREMSEGMKRRKRWASDSTQMAERFRMMTKPTPPSGHVRQT